MFSLKRYHAATFETQLTNFSLNRQGIITKQQKVYYRAETGPRQELMSPQKKILCIITLVVPRLSIRSCQPLKVAVGKVVPSSFYTELFSISIV